MEHSGNLYIFFKYQHAGSIYTGTAPVTLL